MRRGHPSHKQARDTGVGIIRDQDIPGTGQLDRPDLGGPEPSRAPRIVRSQRLGDRILGSRPQSIGVEPSTVIQLWNLAAALQPQIKLRPIRGLPVAEAS